MSITQSSWVPLGLSASEICGRARLSTVLSIDTSSTGSISTARAHQRRTGAVPGWRRIRGRVGVDTVQQLSGRGRVDPPQEGNGTKYTVQTVQ
ncbi:hypothetical protein KIV56_04675 [Cryobacterium breve]|uniref:Uncharacterized protein n=1 Tax=Cryobacterium breve TaxID=1259258 RepID=A0ABY7NGH4_9MICO|nr:hypothetical protein KIV56_04675 [Cryobacterium breve]